MAEAISQMKTVVDIDIVEPVFPPGILNDSVMKKVIDIDIVEPVFPTIYNIINSPNSIPWSDLVGDLNNDGVVDGADLAILLASWNVSPVPTYEFPCYSTQLGGWVAPCERTTDGSAICTCTTDGPSFGTNQQSSVPDFWVNVVLDNIHKDSTTKKTLAYITSSRVIPDITGKPVSLTNVNYKDPNNKRLVKNFKKLLKFKNRYFNKV